MHVRNNRGETLSLSDVMKINIVPAPQQITRDNRQRAVIFYANPGPGAELRQPMSFAIIGGIIFSTALTLVVIPCAYSILTGLERRKEHYSGGQAQAGLSGAGSGDPVSPQPGPAISP